MRVQICSICEGTGEVEGETIRGFDTETCECRKCDGTGRVITGGYKYEVPFTKNKSLIYDAETKIVGIARELEKR